MQPQQKEKAWELRKQDDAQLIDKLNKLRSELVGLRTSKVSSAPQVKLARIRVRICFQIAFLFTLSLHLSSIFSPISIYFHQISIIFMHIFSTIGKRVVHK